MLSTGARTQWGRPLAGGGRPAPNVHDRARRWSAFVRLRAILDRVTESHGQGPWDLTPGAFGLLRGSRGAVSG